MVLQWSERPPLGCPRAGQWAGLGSIGQCQTPAGPVFTGLRRRGAGGPGWPGGVSRSPLGVCKQRGHGTHQGGCQGVMGWVGGRETRALPASGALALTILHQRLWRFKQEWRPQRGLCLFFFKHLFIYLAVLGLSCSAGDLSLWCAGSVGGVHGLSCLAACGVLVPRSGIESVAPELQGGFLTARKVPGL